MKKIDKECHEAALLLLAFSRAAHAEEYKRKMNLVAQRTPSPLKRKITIKPPNRSKPNQKLISDGGHQQPPLQLGNKRVMVDECDKLPPVPCRRKITFNGNSAGINHHLPPIRCLQEGRIMQCSKPFTKVLTDSDLQMSLGRLMLKKCEMGKIVAELDVDINNLMKNGIQVRAFDEDGKVYMMTFKLWSEGKYYVLTKGWNMFLKDKGLHANKDSVTVWMFKMMETGELCFALIPSRNMNID